MEKTAEYCRFLRREINTGKNVFWHSRIPDMFLTIRVCSMQLALTTLTNRCANMQTASAQLSTLAELAILLPLMEESVSGFQLFPMHR
jgi:hypothetical protein